MDRHVITALILSVLYGVAASPVAPQHQALEPHATEPPESALDPNFHVAQQFPGSDLRCTLGGRYIYGPVEGMLQTPSGGEPGPTRLGRPTLEELGIDTASLL